MVAIETMCCNFRFVVIYVVVGFIFDEHLPRYIRPKMIPVSPTDECMCLITS